MARHRATYRAQVSKLSLSGGDGTGITMIRAVRPFTAASLGATTLAVLCFVWSAATEQSLTGDEPYHLVAGHQMLTHGTNALNLEHPPLVKWLAALGVARDPLLASEKPLTLEQVRPHWDRIFARSPVAMRAFVLRARLPVVVAIVLPLLAVSYGLGRAFAGRHEAGILLLAVVGLAIPSLPYLPLVHTDAAAGLGFALTALALLAHYRRPSPLTALAVGVSLGVALAAKFTGLFAVPAVTMVCLVAGGGSLSWLRRLAFGAIAATVALALLLGSYRLANSAYDPALGRRALRDYVHGRGALIVGERLRPWESPLLSLEEHSPALAQYLTGALGVRAQNAIGIYPSYAFGHLTSQGRWWYFPVLLAVKTPLWILLPLPLAAYSWLRKHRRGAWARPQVFVPLLLAGPFLASAMASSYNLGVRHLLPILPLLFLPVAWWGARRPARMAPILVLAILESLMLRPLWLSATNTWFLAEHNPTRLAFSAGNLAYKQNFFTLAQTARRRELDPLLLYYPGTTATEIAAYLPHARLLEPDDPLEPGWYAVGVHAEQILPAVERTSPERFFGYPNYSAIAARWLPQLRQIQERGSDHGIVAGSFHLYRVGLP